MEKKYLLISLLVVGIDAVYLNSISNYFNYQIKAIQGSKIRLNILATILCYLIITLGIYYFMVERKFSIKEMAILGVFAYGIYETTNKALFNNWFWKTVLLETRFLEKRFLEKTMFGENSYQRTPKKSLFGK